MKLYGGASVPQLQMAGKLINVEWFDWNSTTFEYIISCWVCIFAVSERFIVLHCVEPPGHHQIQPQAQKERIASEK